ncbi:ATP-grasp domain-containing protein [Streptomyces sp. PKU-MA01144]|uniref:acetyl/propionyl/methylcrotonyl-CoA carboxylase subunit alpha n=1 Tax=Streptomyces sp. PKU-MA01144 TaxID=2729138 RepID=UPI00147EB532|nr:biotin carboxylase N-terminal domain-containing protein [Streptomyces sp. PKU-MA01144]NNJ03212.1 ATP-grasp domain-containing protein [Streptomyces sp. PKU-MA01144]
MIETLLVANRGEIACRVFRTCRELGIATVAVYADPDEGALHTREADAAVRLPGAAPAATYLRGDLIVKAALAAGADAVHPGYGFLSENADFAREVVDAGLTWIGPPPDAIEAMASKTRAKELMGIAPLDAGTVTDADLPLLVKAAAGGGGRGMRVVRELDALKDELAAARAEALSAFGDGEVFVEPYVEGGRHVEVQILADAHGTVWALGTRDCSLQRRHQKVVEEAPAPGLGEELTARLEEMAVRAARATGYRGAGTVEFLVVGDRAHFLEMNTRLQVEHPVTEAVFGVDLVALQIRVAEGAVLPPAPPARRGHAVEARLYAEDPSRSWSPQTGTLHALSFPAGGGPVPTRGGGASGSPSGPGWTRGGGASGGPSGPGSTPGGGTAGSPSGPGPVPGDGASGTPAPRAWTRVDAGYGDGDRIGVHYDAMIAKVVVWAPTRREAVRRLAGDLARARIHGPVTNRELLVRSLRHPEFAEARMDTGFYDRHLPALTGAADGEELAALAAALADAAARRAGGDAAGTTARLGGWRNLPSQPQVKRYRGRDTEHEVRYRFTRDGVRAEDFPGVRVRRAAPDAVRIETDGVEKEFRIAVYGDDRVHVDTPTSAHTLTRLPRFPDPTAQREPGSLLAPMPGTVVRVAEGIALGAAVTAGQPLVWLEAMKMEHRITAPASGTLTALHAAPGRQVEVGALLAVVQAAAQEEHPS